MAKEFICIVCPKGCHINVDGDNITGYSCPRGLNYVKQEMVDPRRTLTSTMIVEGGNIRVCPVKSSDTLPKDKVIDVVKLIDKTTAHAPIKVGDVLIKNVLSLGVDIIATKDIDRI